LRVSMDPAYVAVHIEEEARHWWFLGRQAVLLSVARATLPPGKLRLVEIWRGGGAFLAAAAEFGQIVGVEAVHDFLAAASRRGGRVLAGLLPDELPLREESFDGALLFDVLEHIDDDRAALQAVRRILKPGGLVMCSAPAYPWLWSSHDEVLGHARRYTARSLSRAAADAGLDPLRTTYFNTLLAAPIVVARVLGGWRRTASADVSSQGRGPEDRGRGPRAGRPRHDLRQPAPWLNALLARIFSFEARLLRWVNLPFGISVLLVACRPAR